MRCGSRHGFVRGVARTAFPSRCAVASSYAAEVTEEDEAKSLDRVVVELEQRFPGVPRPIVERIVADGYRQFDGASIREYIPVMVKHSARASLSSIVGDSRAKFGRSF